MRTAIFAWVFSLIAAAFDGGCSRCSAPSRDDTEPSRGAKVTCPVCGLEFDASEAAATRDHQGKKYHFLLEDHARAFAENPGLYLEKKQ